MIRVLPDLKQSTPFRLLNYQIFSPRTTFRMVQSAHEDVPSDPSIENQWDNETPKKEQFQDLYKIADGLKVSLLGTNRSGIGPVFRSMAIAKRIGPDFFYLANKNSQKFKDLENDSTATITFQNSSTQDWVSITGDVGTYN